MLILLEIGLKLTPEILVGLTRQMFRNDFNHILALAVKEPFLVI